MKLLCCFTIFSFFVIFISCNYKNDKKIYYFQKDLDISKGSLKKKDTSKLDNSSYSYHVTNEIETIIEANGEEVKNNNTSDITLLYRLMPQNQNGTRNIKITFEKFKINIKKEDSETEINSDNHESINPVEKFISGFKDVTLEVYIDSNGKVNSEEGIRNFTNSVFAKFTNAFDIDKDQIKVQVSKLLGNSFLKNSIELGNGILPLKPVAIGDKWKKNYSNEINDLNLITETNFTLTSVEQNLAIIKATSEIHNADLNSNNKENSMISQSVLKGNQDSEFEIDVSNGLLINEKTSSKINGEMKVMGRTFPIQIRITKKVVGTKI